MQHVLKICSRYSDKKGILTEMETEEIAFPVMVEAAQFRVQTYEQ